MELSRLLTALSIFIGLTLTSVSAQNLFDSNRKARRAFDDAFAAQK
ncbi:MAG: hypothetical protein ACI8XO_003810, partial [Verrucomicrobiales bacterium]